MYYRIAAIVHQPVFLLKQIMPWEEIVGWKWMLDNNKLDSWEQFALVASYVWNTSGAKRAKSINDVLLRRGPDQSPEEMDAHIRSWVAANGGVFIDPNKKAG